MQYIVLINVLRTSRLMIPSNGKSNEDKKINLHYKNNICIKR